METIIKEITLKAKEYLKNENYTCLGLLNRSTKVFIQTCINEGHIKVFRQLNGDNYEDYFFLDNEKIDFKLIQGNNVFDINYN